MFVACRSPQLNWELFCTFTSRGCEDCLCVVFQTFKHKKKSFPEGTLKYDLHKRANASLNSGIDLKHVVRLPPDEDLNDWIAVHGKDLNIKK